MRPSCWWNKTRARRYTRGQANGRPRRPTPRRGEAGGLAPPQFSRNSNRLCRGFLGRFPPFGSTVSEHASTRGKCTADWMGMRQSRCTASDVTTRDNPADSCRSGRAARTNFIPIVNNLRKAADFVAHSRPMTSRPSAPSHRPNAATKLAGPVSGRYTQSNTNWTRLPPGGVVLASGFEKVGLWLSSTAHRATTI